ncbi:hypothetical protein ACFWPX_29920 [Nocardia sp. NPDC058518]|uniref:hypothetical protein n=1 Tax=Nocardia sp. NPDC058518 TaxID=3346534 RepID=UPI00365C275F
MSGDDKAAAADWMAWAVANDNASTPAPEGQLAQPIDDGDEMDSTVYAAPFVDHNDPMVAIAASVRERDLARRRRHRLLRTTGIVGGVAAAGVAVFVGALVVATPDAPETTAATVATPSLVPAVATTSVAAPAPWCAEVDTLGRAVSSGPGNLDTEMGVIVFQQYAWYVLRDADKARSVLAPDAVAASPEATRDAVAAVPAGTKHCVVVSAREANKWNVQITERHVDGSDVTWEQVVTTAQRDGAIAITSITAAPK